MIREGKVVKVYRVLLEQLMNQVIRVSKVFRVNMVVKVDKV